MASQDTLWERFLKPVFGLIMDKKALTELYESKDWQKESDALSQPNFIYPEYYRSQNFHGIEGGYLTIEAAISYDAITQYALPPNEIWVRQELLKAIQVKPRRILDVGCGTGSTTLLLKQAYPEAEVVGIDLSPYMLAMAKDKAEKAGLEINWLHKRAERTLLSELSVDLITVSLVFHETPPYVSQAIIQEAFRLLVPGGQIIILDGNQQMLRQTQWLTEIFEEPYIKVYSQENLENWLDLAGFRAIKTDIFWMIHQITQGVKPLTQTKPRQAPEESDFLANSTMNPAF